MEKTQGPAMEEGWQDDNQNQNSVSTYNNISHSHNPLLMEPILEQIFDFLDEKELMKCRMVCQMWLTEGDRSLDKLHSFDIGSVDDLTRLLSKIHENSIFKVSTLRAHDVSLENPMFQEILALIKHSLTNLIMEDIKVTLPTYCQIIEQVAPTLKRLEMGTLKTVEGIYHRYFPLASGQLTVYPNLTSLEFLSFNDSPNQATKISAIAAMFPNLISLVACNAPPEKPEKFHKLRLNNLRSLEIRAFHSGPAVFPTEYCCRREHYLREGGMRQDHFQAIMNMKVKLRKIKLYNLHPSVSNEQFQEFLESQKETLEELEVFNLDNKAKPISTPGPVPFPLELPKVKAVNISKSHIRNLTHVLKSFPSLHEIEFRFPEKEENAWGRILPARLPSFENVKVLIINWILPQHLVTLSKAFPTLKVFKLMGCDDELLRTSFKVMTSVENFIVIQKPGKRMPTDEGFTGIPAKTLKTMSRLSEVSEVRKWPFIGDMKNLKTLTLIGLNPRVTERTLLFGIIGMTNLEYVSSEIKLTSKKCIHIMTKRGFFFSGSQGPVYPQRASYNFFVRGEFLANFSSKIADIASYLCPSDAYLKSEDEMDKEWESDSEDED